MAAKRSGEVVSACLTALTEANALLNDCRWEEGGRDRSGLPQDTWRGLYGDPPKKATPCARCGRALANNRGRRTCDGCGFPFC